MTFFKMFFLFLGLGLVSGCTAIKVSPVDTTLKIKHICIEDCQQTCFDGDMMGVIRDGFERNGISSQIFTGSLPSECEYHLSVMCARTWDLAMYMHHAELRMYRANTQIGYAEYHLNGGGGFALTKFGSTKSKIDPVIDELLNGKPVTK
jgi:hypothetical protein